MDKTEAHEIIRQDLDWAVEKFIAEMFSTYGIPREQVWERLKKEDCFELRIGLLEKYGSHHFGKKNSRQMGNP